MKTSKPLSLHRANRISNSDQLPAVRMGGEGLGVEVVSSQVRCRPGIGMGLESGLLGGIRMGRDQAVIVQ